MFDPLDYISTLPPLSSQDQAEESRVPTYLLEDDRSRHIPQAPQRELIYSERNELNDIPISVQDLPMVHYADSTTILVILKLLAPNTQVNFDTNDADIKTWTSFIEEKGIAMESFEKLIQYYIIWGNQYLITPESICEKIPALLTQDSRHLLSYYTVILSYYDNSDLPMRDDILKQVGLRIAEKCGRTAAPSMTRKFHIDGISQDLLLHEPSLTSDNLGLKTWGASLLLAQRVTAIQPGLYVLELGAGTGLVGIAYAISHREFRGNIFLTDLPEIVPNLQHNINLNQLQDVQAAVLDWTNPRPFLDSFKTDKFDIILIADPIYSSKHPVWIVNMIKNFLRSTGKAYIEIPIRPKYAAERQILWELLATKQLEVITKQYEDGHDDWGPCQYVYAEIVHQRTYVSPIIQE